jgi:diaminopimelate epimerase
MSVIKRWRRSIKQTLLFACVFVRDKRRMEFVKYQGLGNDFIMINNLDSSTLKLSSNQAVKLCNRHFGIGADGVIFVLQGTNDCDYSMRIFNSDGSEPQMCGNGIRCFAKYVQELNQKEEGSKPHQGRSYQIWTSAGIIISQITSDGLVTVDMGEPILSPNHKLPTTLQPTQNNQVINAPIEMLNNIYYTTVVSMGNPHAVIFVETLKEMNPPFPVIGPILESYSAFPERVNVEFVEIINENHVVVKVWERGAGPTLACGTGEFILTINF